MSFMSKLAEKGLVGADKALAKHGDKWVDKAVEAGREKVAELAEDSLEPAGVAAANQGFDWVEANKPRIARLGHDALTAVAGLVASGDKKAARLIWLRDEAGWDELDAAADEASDGVRGAVDALGNMIGLGKDAARVLFPILLSIAPAAL
jgi:hypothetical protein